MIVEMALQGQSQAQQRGSPMFDCDNASSRPFPVQEHDNSTSIDEFPLSNIQKSLLRDHSLLTKRAGCNLRTNLYFTGTVDFSKLRLAFDRTSMRRITAELWELYEAYLDHRRPQLSPAGVEYSEYVSWESQCADSLTFEEIMKSEGPGRPSRGHSLWTGEAGTMDAGI